MNKLKKGDKLFTGYCWIPRLDMENVMKDIEAMKENNNRNVEVPNFMQVNGHNVKPPSLFRMNAYTWAFQEIVNTYGIPSYKEVNPAVFACVTFPFLFGIMFGDLGHGFVLFIIGAFMCLFYTPLITRSPGMEMILKARYLILMMGFFATFCGLIYNDFMAIPIFAKWGSCYDVVPDPHHHDEEIAILKPDCTYAIGIDPIWYVASNELGFLNSLKMKISVILGVL